MSDDQLDVKFDGLTDGILPPARAGACRHAWELADAGDIGRAGAAG